MALLNTLINQFLMENQTCPEYWDGLKADMEMWVAKSTELDVSATAFYGDAVIVHSLTLHVPLKPHLQPLTAQPISDSFGSASNPPGSSAYFSFSLMDSHMTLVCFYYLSLLDALSFPCLHFDP